ncbi:MAG: hypothetical protein FWH50_00880 [Coriobacteriia bacterium]|nr:hypothetical protein [Coriobacteriia bacterium]
MAESNHRGYPSIGANRLCGLLFSITPAAAMSPFAQAQAQGKDSQKTTLQQVTGHDELFSEVDPSYSGELAKPEGPNNPTGQENNHPGVEKTASLRDSLIALAERLADDRRPWVPQLAYL